jgi:hypothetical protein
MIRPVLFFGISPKERAGEAGMSKSSIYYKANLFDQAGMCLLGSATKFITLRALENIC